MRIRPSRAEDVPQLFEIWRSAVEATHHFLSAGDRDFFTRLVRDQYLASGQFEVAVDEADRHGRGIGRRMIEHVRALRVRLVVDVNEQNETAVGFYERLGFRRLGRSDKDDSGRPYSPID